MSVAGSISNALLRFGRPITLRRTAFTAGVPGANTDVVVYGVSDGNAAKELTDGVNQGVSQVTFANTQIAAASWPGPPKKNDMLIFDGRNTIIQSVEPKYLGSAILVYICQVTG